MVVSAGEGRNYEKVDVGGVWRWCSRQTSRAVDGRVDVGAAVTEGEGEGGSQPVDGRDRATETHAR